jgi:uncharacterized membrane protein YgdD (TMEM256/DUF423 family)
MTVTILIALAGLMGAGGVVLGAAGAHLAPSVSLDSAAYMLLFHAVAVIGGAALVRQGVVWRPLALLVLAAWVLGAVLFSGDVAMRAFTAHRLFPFAAPSGGFILIGAWLALTIAAIAAVVRS